MQEISLASTKEYLVINYVSKDIEQIDVSVNLKQNYQVNHN